MLEGASVTGNVWRGAECGLELCWAHRHCSLQANVGQYSAERGPMLCFESISRSSSSSSSSQNSVIRSPRISKSTKNNNR